jgi:hypothetical protein
MSDKPIDHAAIFHSQINEGRCINLYCSREWGVREMRQKGSKELLTLRVLLRRSKLQQLLLYETLREQVGKAFRQFLQGETPKIGLPHQRTASPLTTDN